MLTIGKLADFAGVTPDTLRFYEREGLMPVPKKSEAGYRLYETDAVRRIGFIREAQSCGFTLAEIGELLALRESEDACCGDVRRRALEKKLQLETKIRTLKAMSKALNSLITDCVEDGLTHPVGECPILAALESSRAARSA